MLPGVMLKELAISVNSSDDSYMPKNIAVLVGNVEGSLRQVKTVVVPRWVVGSKHTSLSFNHFTLSHTHMPQRVDGPFRAVAESRH